MTDDDRAVRALTDVVAAEEVAPGLMRIVTWSDEYHVDARDAGCNCPDSQHNLGPGEWCKHRFAALLADVDRLPDPYVHEIDARPARPDGGEECEECAALPDGWPCADCYISGDAEITEEPYA